MKNNKTIKILYTCIIICFLFIGGPLIIPLNNSSATVFGMPPIYTFVFIIWVILCILTFIGYKLKWGDKDDDKKQ